MGISKYPSIVTLPNGGEPYPSILEFLVMRFPTVAREEWEQRISEGKVLAEGGIPITMATGYVPRARIFYFREVAVERAIPFQEQVLFQDGHILVACKPHFLPVTPGGAYVEECLLNRLRKRGDIDYLEPIHRIDRETAGIVMFSVNPKTNRLYHALFRNHEVEKSYLALSEGIPFPGETEWNVENRIVSGEPWFRMKTAAGTANSRSRIQLAGISGDRASFLLTPYSGKTHQLRIHMSGLGFQILNDRLYPELQPETDDDFTKPLQLIAKELTFRDPVSGKDMAFESQRTLLSEDHTISSLHGDTDAARIP